jgi:hypothetical protein
MAKYTASLVLAAVLTRIVDHAEVDKKLKYLVNKQE